MSAPLHLAVIIGSVREGRFGPTVAGWFAQQAEQRDGLTVDLIDLRDLPAAALANRIEAADAVAVVTPEYNHSFPGPLKHAIDSVGRQWHAKPVALVSYGGISGGLRASEALRPVFAEVHAMTVRHTVSFAFPWDRFDADGTLRDPADAATATTALLDQLVWWAVALRDARTARPYVA